MGGFIMSLNKKAVLIGTIGALFLIGLFGRENLSIVQMLIGLFGGLFIIGYSLFNEEKPERKNNKRN